MSEHFRVDQVTSEATQIAPSWNVAPSTSILAVLSRDGLRSLEVVRWGLVPSWSKSVGSGAKMINARAESLLSSGAYRGPLVRHRAVVPMDGFYEWHREPTGKRQPYYFSAPGGEPLAVAALWDAWHDPSGTWLLSATIVTTAARPPVAGIHDRMPVALGPESVESWLDCDRMGAEKATAVLALPGAPLDVWPVDSAVNSVSNNSPELVSALPA